MKRSLLSTFWVLLLLIITVTLLPQTHAKAAEADAETFYYHHLNERQQYFYTWLKDYYDKLPSEPATYQVDLTHLLPAAPTQQDYRSLQEDILYAEMALAEDDPLYLFKGRIHDCGYASTSDNRYFHITVERMEIPTADMQKQVDARIQQIVAIAGTGDRYTQLRKLVDYLKRNTFYDPYADCINNEGHFSHALATRGIHYDTSVYGILLEGVTVCAGYTQTLKVLCSALDIPCIIMANDGHSWNLVQMEDGKWYRIDLTQFCRSSWDDAIDESIIDTYFRDYFLNNSAVDHQNPRNLVLDGVALVTQFPEHATEQYHYTGSTTDFSYTVPASTYTPGNPKFTYRVNSDGKTCTITGYEGKESGDLTIPGKLDSYTVTAIDGYAFYYCTGFTGKLTVPDSVESIGKGAFAGCYNLTSVKLSANLHTIGQGAFIGCKSLTEVTVPDLVDTLGDFVFTDCDKLRTVTFGSHIQRIGSGAFDAVDPSAVLKGPAGSVVQARAADSGLSFQASGSLCSMQSTDGKWEFDGTQHFHICQHGARFGYESHTGMYCGWKCATCGAEYCGMTETYTENVLTLINQKPATCNSLEYTGDLQCICGRTVETGDWVGAFSDHAPADDAWEHDAYNHWQDCTCGHQLKLATHTGGTATATQRARCSVCGEEYGELDPTNTTPVPDQGNSGGNNSSEGNNSSGSNNPSGGNNSSSGNTPSGTGPSTDGTEPTVGTDPSTGTAPSAGNDPTTATTFPAGSTPTTGNDPEDPADSEPASPVLGIIIGIVLTGAVGVGGWYGWQFYRKKQQNTPDNSDKSQSDT